MRRLVVATLCLSIPLLLGGCLGHLKHGKKHKHKHGPKVELKAGPIKVKAK